MRKRQLATSAVGKIVYAHKKLPIGKAVLNKRVAQLVFSPKCHMARRPLAGLVYWFIGTAVK